MRSADALVAVFQADGKADGILHAVAAPRGADAALDRPQGLPVGMATFKTGVDQFLPDVRQLLHLSPEQIDALPARNLGVEAKFFRGFAQGDELVRRDFAAWDARNDRVQPATLHVRQKAIIGVLQRLMFGLHDSVRSTTTARIDVTAGLQISQPCPVPYWAMHVVKRRELFRLDDGKQLGARIRKVFAQVLADRSASGLHGGVEQVGDERQAAAAAGAGLRARLHLAQRSRAPEPGWPCRLRPW